MDRTNKVQNNSPMDLWVQGESIPLQIFIRAGSPSNRTKYISFPPFISDQQLLKVMRRFNCPTGRPNLERDPLKIKFPPQTIVGLSPSARPLSKGFSIAVHLLSQAVRRDYPSPAIADLVGTFYCNERPRWK